MPTLHNIPVHFSETSVTVVFLCMYRSQKTKVDHLTKQQKEKEETNP